MNGGPYARGSESLVGNSLNEGASPVWSHNAPATSTVRPYFKPQAGVARVSAIVLCYSNCSDRLRNSGKGKRLS